MEGSARIYEKLRAELSGWAFIAPITSMAVSTSICVRRRYYIHKKGRHRTRQHDAQRDRM